MQVSLLFSLIKIEEVSRELYILIDGVQNFNTTKNISNDYLYFRIGFSILGLVSLYFLGKFGFGIFKIHRLKNRFQKENFDGIGFYLTNFTKAPFSYFEKSVLEGFD